MGDLPRIRPARWADRRPIATLIADALATTALGHWLVPHKAHRQRVLADVLELWVEHSLFYGDTRVTDDLTAAAVGLHRFRPLPPPANYQPRLIAASGPYRERFLLVDRFIDDNVPVEPHYHLAFLATAPTRHRTGLATAMLEHHRHRLDRLNLPGWTVTTADSKRLFTHHGYTRHVDLPLPDGPVLTAMHLGPHHTRPRPAHRTAVDAPPTPLRHPNPAQHTPPPPTAAHPGTANTNSQQQWRPTSRHHRTSPVSPPRTGKAPGTERQDRR
ncbi:N-acetyltransferase [Micromonospora mangrovi]|uniref:N-acetyltransferase n=2 Tax=Micromonospora TaxID=1873 RepID=A0AAU7MAS8_9ACTN